MGDGVGWAWGEAWAGLGAGRKFLSSSWVLLVEPGVALLNVAVHEAARVHLS